eukprot:31546-Pelagococcus_subviridis.AAC.6
MEVQYVSVLKSIHRSHQLDHLEDFFPVPLRQRLEPPRQVRVRHRVAHRVEPLRVVVVLHERHHLVRVQPRVLEPRERLRALERGRPLELHRVLLLRRLRVMVPLTPVLLQPRVLLHVLRALRAPPVLVPFLAAVIAHDRLRARVRGVPLLPAPRARARDERLLLRLRGELRRVFPDRVAPGAEPPT